MLGYKKYGLRFVLVVFYLSEDSLVEMDLIWDEILEWEFEDDELVFLCIFIKSDDFFVSNFILVVIVV